MLKIRALCLSDLHLGSETSVLTAVDPKSLEPDTTRDSPVLVNLVECLKSILDHHEGTERPHLVLAGDVLELALATTNNAATVFARFAQLLMGNAEPPVDRSIVYVPGNHDHHLWETARERQYAAYINEDSIKLPLEHAPWHATHLFPWREELNVPNRDVESFLLTTLLGLAESSSGSRVLAMYPNYGVMSTDGKNRCTVVHHGHFTESMYHLMSDLRKAVFPKRRKYPEEIWDVEAENFAWIDFLWGTLGRSGEVGKDMELVYNMLKDEEAKKRLAGNLARSISERLSKPWLIRWFCRVAVNAVLRSLMKKFAGAERSVPDRPLGKDSEDRLGHYIGRYVRSQLVRECTDGLPDHVTFVFGHTHKPFENVRPITGIDAPVHIYNTGGWVVDTPETAPHQGGAIVVIDEDGHAASIHMYKQSNDRSSYRVAVAKADKEGKTPNPLYDRLVEIIDPEQPPWSEFSRLAAKTVEERHVNMEEIIRRARG